MGTAAAFRQMSTGSDTDGIISRSMRHIFDNLPETQQVYDVSVKVRDPLSLRSSLTCSAQPTASLCILHCEDYFDSRRVREHV